MLFVTVYEEAIQLLLHLIILQDLYQILLQIYFQYTKLRGKQDLQPEHIISVLMEMTLVVM